VSEFISFITSEAAEKCQLEKRKTIGGEDILYAMVSLGFENYAETLKIHLAKLRQVRRTPRDHLSLSQFSRVFLSIRLQPLRAEKLGRAPKCTQRMSERRWMTPLASS
jgi:hypothetical protein